MSVLSVCLCLTCFIIAWRCRNQYFKGRINGQDRIALEMRMQDLNDPYVIQLRMEERASERLANAIFEQEQLVKHYEKVIPHIVYKLNDQRIGDFNITDCVICME